MTYDGAAVEAWLAEDPDPDTRAELQALIDAGDDAEISDAFSGPLEFGTAGLRGKLGPGPNRMNRAVVRRAAAGLARYLLETDEKAAWNGVVIGYDARHKSADFAADTAAVLTGAGIRAQLLPHPTPTPVLAFAVLHFGCAAGVMVTASHNPAQDNGYKVYLSDGAQIVPPVDARISAHINAVGPLESIVLGAAANPLVVLRDDEPIEAYVAAAAELVDAETARELTVAYTPLHGVGRDVLLRLFDRAGFAAPHVVAAQADPDPEFPTVAFPNPEEPGALDLVIAAARAVGADLVIANDPDADRLAIAIPDQSAKSGWRALRGDEIGALLADFLLSTSSGDDRLVVTTIVSSTLLSKIAAAAGVRYAETLTGFKWIERAAQDRPDARLVLGYEEALGFNVGDWMVHDKDGMGAALVFAELAAVSKRQGESLVARLDGIAERFGLHATSQWSVWLQGTDGSVRIDAVMAALRDKPLPETVAGRLITAVDDLSTGVRRSLDGGSDSVIDLPRSDVLTLHMDGARIVVRPSGTEPKLKMYFEVVVPVRADVQSAREQAERELAALRAEMALLTGL
ncbi:MAG: phospho-sugar mutase [Mycobacteriales bacterium]